MFHRSNILFMSTMTKILEQSERETHTECITPDQLSGFLKRPRKRTAADYFKEYIGGLHEFVQEH